MSNYLNDDFLDCSHALRCVAAFLAGTQLQYGIIISIKSYNAIVEQKNVTSYKNLFQIYADMPIFETYLDKIEQKSATCCKNLLQGGLEKEILRDFYFDKLIKRKNNGLIKVITGIFRCGKSYFLNNLLYHRLYEYIGVF